MTAPGPRWIVITVALAVAILIALALIGYLTGNWNEDESARPGYSMASAQSQVVELPVCLDDQTREQIRGVMVEALDDALKEHVKHVFEVWLKDERGQPERARTGVKQGIKAYIGARKGALDWAPPVCPG